MDAEDVERQDGFVRWADALESTQGLADRGWDSMPSGHRLAWWVSGGWRLADLPAGRACRGGRRCYGHPVALLARQAHLSGGRVATRWWAYCPRHLYANRIEDGQVIHLRLVNLGGDT